MMTKDDVIKNYLPNYYKSQPVEKHYAVASSEFIVKFIDEHESKIKKYMHRWLKGKSTTQIEQRVGNLSKAFQSLLTFTHKVSSGEIHIPPGQLERITKLYLSFFSEDRLFWAAVNEIDNMVNGTVIP